LLPSAARASQGCWRRGAAFVTHGLLPLLVPPLRLAHNCCCSCQPCRLHPSQQSAWLGRSAALAAARAPVTPLRVKTVGGAAAGHATALCPRQQPDAVARACSDASGASAARALHHLPLYVPPAPIRLRSCMHSLLRVALGCAISALLLPLRCSSLCAAAPSLQGQGLTEGAVAGSGGRGRGRRRDGRLVFRLTLPVEFCHLVAVVAARAAEPVAPRVLCAWRRLATAHLPRQRDAVAGSSCMRGTRFQSSPAGETGPLRCCNARCRARSRRGHKLKASRDPIPLIKYTFHVLCHRQWR
jgi:hypothetical protein